MSIKILMVCLGNICRSPLAEGILASKLPKNNFIVDSAGTSNYHVGQKPDKRSIEVAKINGLDISNQRARQFKVEDFYIFDFIYVMDNSNFKDIIQLAPDEASKSKVKLILNSLFINENVDVPDPYFGLENGFSIVYKMLDQACDCISSKLQQH